ncbi:hypothetical protein C8Q80DRAFT_1288241 [Daedaleopsis nitida]|nr:hypothetical protein C8Q80DRAFT_1288241 [Daedaleopsis nitida]
MTMDHGCRDSVEPFASAILTWFSAGIDNPSHWLANATCNHRRRVGTIRIARRDETTTTARTSVTALLVLHRAANVAGAAVYYVTVAAQHPVPALLESRPATSVTGRTRPGLRGSRSQSRTPNTSPVSLSLRTSTLSLVALSSSRSRTSLWSIPPGDRSNIRKSAGRRMLDSEALSTLANVTPKYRHCTHSGSAADITTAGQLLRPPRLVLDSSYGAPVPAPPLVSESTLFAPSVRPVVSLATEQRV